MPNQGSGGQTEAIQHSQQVGYMGIRLPFAGQRRTPEAAQVVADELATPGEKIDLGIPHAPIRPQTMDEDQSRPRAGGLVVKTSIVYISIA